MYIKLLVKTRDGDLDPFGSVDLLPAGSGSITFFIGSGSGPDPTSQNGFIKLIHLEQNINQNQQIQA